MRSLVWIAGVSLLAGCAGLTIRPDGVTVLSPETAAALLAEAPETLIVDVSPPDDYAAAHLEGAVNVPRSQLWMRMPDMPPDQGHPILVCDSSGERSRSAALLLRDEGYYRVYELRGGIRAWLEAGYALKPGL